jgi:hypothetical protein
LSAFTVKAWQPLHLHACEEHVVTVATHAGE